MLMLSFAALLSSLSLQAGLWDDMTSYFRGESPSEPPSIRILLLHDVEQANLEVKGKYSLIDPFTGKRESVRFAGKNRTIQAAKDGLKWGEAFPDLHQIQIKPGSEQTVTIVDGRPYEGLVSVYDIGKTISIVNQVSVESYVRSILTNYSTQGLEPEALAAFAIAIRTNAYYQVNNPKTKFWDVDAQKVGYGGMESGSGLTDSAVNTTKYMIMSKTGIYEGKATPFNAQIGTYSGGQVGKDAVVSAITLDEANAMAKKGDHAAQILAKAFPGTTIMMMKFSK